MGKMEQKIDLQIRAYPRLHLTLLAMHTNNYRNNGGIGFSINEPNCTISFTKSRSVDCKIEDHRSHSLSVSERNKLKSLIIAELKKNNFMHGVSIDISGAMRSHSGFGSGTAISLACIEGLHIVNGNNPNPIEVIKSSGRGGTSGVGINSYFSGGCVFDLGKPNNSSHLPSNKSTNTELPLVLDQLPMPYWELGICIPNLPTKTPAEEELFFKTVCPIEAAQAHETIYHALFGLYASIKIANKNKFCEALKAIQNCAWKKSERQLYGSKLKVIEDVLYSAGADAVGMSSLGPTLFFFASDIVSVIENSKSKLGDCEFHIAKPINHGRVLDV